MKYLYFLLLTTVISACNNKDVKQKSITEEELIPFYKLSDLKQGKYSGNVQQINDTVYDYVEKKNGQWVSPNPDYYNIYISQYDKSGNKVTREIFSISGDNTRSGSYTTNHTATFIHKRINDTVITYGIAYDTRNGKTDTIMESYLKPIASLAYTLTLYDIDKKSRQRQVKETNTEYLDNNYKLIKTITSYPNEVLSDTTTYKTIADRTNEADTNNTKAILAKDNVGNTTLMLDRQDPSRKQLHRIGYSYYK